MKIKELVLEIADIFIATDEYTSDWINIPILRNSWYALFISILLMFIVFIFGQALPIDTSRDAVFFYRALILFFLAISSACLLFLSFNYLRYVVKNNYQVSVRAVLDFYIFQIFFWALMYRNIYLLLPDAFYYNNPPIENTEFIIRGMPSIIISFHFLIYSAFQSLNGYFYRITCNSILPSILGWIQSLFTLSLLALLIASYVNQKSYPRKTKENGNEKRRTNG